MPESRGGGTSGTVGRLSSAGAGAGQTPSWRMEVPEEDEEEESSDKSPDIPEADLKEINKDGSCSPLWRQGH